MRILAELSDFELLLLYLQSNAYACCVHNIMGILQYVVAIEINGGACPYNTKYGGVCF